MIKYEVHLLEGLKLHHEILADGFKIEAGCYNFYERDLVLFDPALNQQPEAVFKFVISFPSSNVAYISNKGESRIERPESIGL